MIFHAKDNFGHHSNQGEFQRRYVMMSNHHIVRKYNKRYLFVYSNILFWIICCFKVFLFFIKGTIVLSEIFAHFYNRYLM